MIYKTRKSALHNAHSGEQAVPVISRWKRCELECFCIRTEPRQVGWSLVLR